MEHMLHTFKLPPFDGFKCCLVGVVRKSTLDSQNPSMNVKQRVRYYFERCMQCIDRLARGNNHLVRDKALLARETLITVYRLFFCSDEFMGHQDRLDLQALGYPAASHTAQV